MAATALSHSDIDPSKGLARMQLYELRRLAASQPYFLNHTPRDTAPAFENQDFVDYATRAIDPPYHLDLDLGLAGTNNRYWSEDDSKKTRAHRARFAASTHSRSAPTSPIVERSAFLESRDPQYTHGSAPTSPIVERSTFLEPRDPQYTHDQNVVDVVYFLTKTGPSSAWPKSDAEVDAQKRQNSVKKVRTVVKKTARRVLEVGNEQLPSQCQLPHLQRSRALSKGQSDQAIEKVTNGGMKYYEIVPAADQTDLEQSDAGIARVDWAPKHRAARVVTSRNRTRSAKKREDRDPLDGDSTDVYGTMSESEGPHRQPESESLLFRQPQYQPGTALGEPTVMHYIKARKFSADSALGAARHGSVDSRMADSELTDGEQDSGPSTGRKISQSRHPYRPRTSVSSGHTQVLCQGGRPVSTITETASHQGLRHSHDNRFQATLASFPAAPSNAPTRNPSVNTRPETRPEVQGRTVASSLNARLDRTRARKLQHLQQVRKMSVESGTGSMESSATAGTREPLMDDDLAQRMVQGQTPLIKPETCDHGFSICPHGCSYAGSESAQSDIPHHLQPEQIAYRSTLPLPPTPDHLSEQDTHPALRHSNFSPGLLAQKRSMPAHPRQFVESTASSASSTPRPRAISSAAATSLSIPAQHEAQLLAIQQTPDSIRQGAAVFSAIVTAVAGSQPQFQAQAVISSSADSPTTTLEPMQPPVLSKEAATTVLALAAHVYSQSEAQSRAEGASNPSSSRQISDASDVSRTPRNRNRNDSGATASSTFSEKHTSSSSNTSDPNSLEVVYSNTRKGSLTPTVGQAIAL